MALDKNADVVATGMTDAMKKELRKRVTRTFTGFWMDYRTTLDKDEFETLRDITLDTIHPDASY